VRVFCGANGRAVSHAFYNGIDWNTLDSHSYEWGSGGFVSTVEDQNRFLRAWVDGDLFDNPASKTAMSDWAAAANKHRDEAREQSNEERGDVLQPTSKLQTQLDPPNGRKEEVMKYKSIVVTRRGGLDAVQIRENELRPPPAARRAFVSWLRLFARMISPSAVATVLFCGSHPL